MGKSTHLGIKDLPRRSTLSDANSRRDEGIFGKIYMDLYQTYKDKLSSDSPSHKVPKWMKRLQIIDYEKFEQMTQRGVIYVTKMKQNLTYETLSSTYYMNSKGQMQWREEYVVFRKEVKAKETDENGEEKEVKRIIEHKARIVTYVDEKKHRLSERSDSRMEFFWPCDHRQNHAHVLH